MWTNSHQRASNLPTSTSIPRSALPQGSLSPRGNTPIAGESPPILIIEGITNAAGWPNGSISRPLRLPGSCRSRATPRATSASGIWEGNGMSQMPRLFQNMASTRASPTLRAWAPSSFPSPKNLTLPVEHPSRGASGRTPNDSARASSGCNAHRSPRALWTRLWGSSTRLRPATNPFSSIYGLMMSTAPSGPRWTNGEGVRKPSIRESSTPWTNNWRAFSTEFGRIPNSVTTPSSLSARTMDTNPEPAPRNRSGAPKPGCMREASGRP